MGLLSWLFPGPEDRIANAKAALARGRPDHARLDLEGLDHPDAPALRKQAETALARLNLDAALMAGRAGDDARAAECLQLAESFHHGGLEEEFRLTRGELREIRASRDAAGQKKANDERVRLLDPETGESPFDEEAEELAQRLALHFEGYPAALRSRASDLGPPFAEAVLAGADGRWPDAWTGLQSLPDTEPLVAWERSRAARELGDGATAVASLRRFAELASGHHEIGGEHTAVTLASLLAEQGDAKSATRVLRDLHASGAKVPPSGAFLLSRLLAGQGDLAGAETLLRGLVTSHPKEQVLYTTLARVRLQGGHRKEAMRALEASMEACCSSPGKCGDKPPDLDTHRLLATLYLEDGLETGRALELAQTAASLVQQVTWDDAYLSALVAKTQGRTDAMELARRLRDQTPPALMGRVERLLTA